MTQKNQPVQDQICPFLGLRYDRETVTDFASAANHCHRSPHPRAVELDYQEQICLTRAYLTCPIYLQAGPNQPPAAAPLPIRRPAAATTSVPAEPARANRTFRLLLYFGLVILFAALIGLFGLLRILDWPGPGDMVPSETPAGEFLPTIAPTEGPTALPSLTAAPPSPTATWTATPTTTPTATETATATPTSTWTSTVVPPTATEPPPSPTETAALPTDTPAAGLPTETPTP